MPVFNGLPHLRAQFAAMMAQDIECEWEAVYVDNGSTDGSQAFIAAQAARLPDRIRLIDGSQKPGQVYARNRGIEAARGDLLAFNDQDDLPASDWLAELVKALQHADAVGGFVQLTPAGESPGGFVPAPHPTLPIFFGRFPVALGTNFGIHRHVLAGVGGWQDLGVFAGEDVDLSIRLQTGGFRLVYAPKARVIWRSRTDLRGVYKQGFVYGRSDVIAYAKYRHLCLPRPSVRDVLRSWKHIALDLLKCAIGRSGWQLALHKIGWKMGRLRESIRLGTVYL